jgi:hypothetical protein
MKHVPKQQAHEICRSLFSHATGRVDELPPKVMESIDLHPYLQFPSIHDG